MQRLATNACPRLDVFQLHRAGALTNGAVTKWVWVLPAFSLTVTARAEAHRLMFSANDGLDTSAAITGVPATLGNTYPYFACTACDRLVRYLYVQNETLPAAAARTWNSLRDNPVSGEPPPGKLHACALSLPL